MVDKEDKLNYIKDNNVYIYGEIDDNFDKDIVAPFMRLIDKEKLKKEPEINIYIESY